MSFVKGLNVLLKVDVGSTTQDFQGLSGEIETTFSGSAEVLTAANKNSTGFRGKEVSGREWQIQGSGHIDADAADAALQQIENAFKNGTKETVQWIVPSPYNTYEGDVVVSSFEMSAPEGDYVQVSFTLEGDGEYTETAS